MPFDLKEYLKSRQEWCNEYIARYVDMRCDDSFALLRDAMNYSLFAGGKRVRPILAMGACRACGGREKDALPFGVALEMVHTFSLIHDDLPSMDDDDYRRGKPSNHKIYGEAHAILAGDALLAEAFRMLACPDLYPPVTPEAGLEIMREVAEATGVTGMVGGQSLDLISENKPIVEDRLYLMHLCKTARFIACSTVTGAIAAGAEKAKIEAMRQYGLEIGLAFQIVDDCLNAVGDEKVMGKATGSDAERGKATYPALYGVEKSREIARGHVDKAVEALADFADKAEILRAIALYIIERDR